MRLYDEIRSNYWDRLGPKMREVFLRAERFSADNVSEYYFALTDQEVWDVEHFPNVAPPFPTFWIESKKPSKIVTEVESSPLPWQPPRETGIRRPERWGVLFNVVPKESLLPSPDPDSPLYASIYTLEHLGLFKWVVHSLLFLDMGDDRMMGDKGVSPSWAWTLPITSEGKIHTLFDQTLQETVAGFSYSIRPEITNLVKYGGTEGRARYKSARAEAHAYFHPLLLTLTFLHCKNVNTVLQQPDRKLVRRRAKEGKTLSSYRVLDIKPIQRMIADARQPGETGIQHALHRCRAHFKTYTEDRPLLGRAVGTYFWNDQLRGKSSRGTRSKDYNVLPPTPQKKS